jgi:membrane glycosyltransferase
MAITKAQLNERIASLDAQLIAAGRTIAGLREQLAMTAPAPAVQHSPATHNAYYAYVRAQRVAARACGQRITSYKTFQQWIAS